jgi:hypothetical protein
MVSPLAELDGELAPRLALLPEHSLQRLTLAAFGMISSKSS